MTATREELEKLRPISNRDREEDINDNEKQKGSIENPRFFKYPRDNQLKNRAYIKFRELISVQETTSETGGNQLITKDIAGNIVKLYLPKEGITVKDNANYNQSALQIVGSFVAEGKFEGFEETLTGVASEVTQSAITAANVLTGGQVETAVLAKVIQRVPFLSNSPVGQGATTRIKRTANPNLRAIFNQVGLRTFQYTFEMIPNNSRDAIEIRNIVTFFRANLYPERVDEVTFQDYVYKFPNKFQIEYYFEGRQIGHRIKPCYLTDVTVSYNAMGNPMAFYHDGEFQSTTLQLSFQEETTLHKGDILDIETDQRIGY